MLVVGRHHRQDIQYRGNKDTGLLQRIQDQEHLHLRGEEPHGEAHAHGEGAGAQEEEEAEEEQETQVWRGRDGPLDEREVPDSGGGGGVPGERGGGSPEVLLPEEGPGWGGRAPAWGRGGTQRHPGPPSHWDGPA